MLLLVLLCAGYSICIILGISFLVSLSNHLYAFSSHCLLFTRGRYEDNGDFTPDWASPFYCIFSLIVTTISVLIAAARLVQAFMMLYKGSRETFAITFKMTVSALVMVLFVLTIGTLISAGFATWCDAVEERFSKGCEAAAASMVISNDTQHIEVKEFFANFETSQFSIWSLFVVWVFVLTISGRMLFVAHERANIRISMARERRRYNHPPDYANQPSNLPHRDITWWGDKHSTSLLSFVITYSLTNSTCRGRQMWCNRWNWEKKFIELLWVLISTISLSTIIIDLNFLTQSHLFIQQFPN